MIETYWIKFDGLDIKCWCRDKCSNSQECEEYVVKFTKVDRSKEELENEIKKLNKASKNLSNQFKKSLDITKGFKL